MKNASRTYKDSLFTHYFSDKHRLIEAYNAMAKTNYSPDTEIEFTTIKNVLFRSQTNDLAFIIEGRLVVLIEHQSTVNENMPLRMLMYIAEIYKGLLDRKAPFSKERRLIPTPEFFVVYNGLEDYPDEKVMRLSDAFLDKGGEPYLELTVPIYNIADGHGKKLLEHSAALSDYASFVSMVYEYRKDGSSPDEAIDKAIHYCLKHAIMKPYLTESSDEVRRMFSMEWDDEIFAEVMREEGEAKGRVIGKAEGIMEVARNMKADGNTIEMISRYTGLSPEDIANLSEPIEIAGKADKEAQDISF